MLSRYRDMQDCNEKMASRSFAYLYLSSLFLFFLFVSPCQKIDRLSSQTVGELNPGKHLFRKFNVFSQLDTLSIQNL